MKPRSRLVEDVNGLPRIALAQFCCQFNTLTLATRERRAALPQFDVAKAHILQHFYLVQNRRYVLEKLHRVVDRHVQHIGNALTFVAHFKRFAVVSLTVTLLAGHVNVRQEVHLDGFVAVALTCLAATALHIKGKTPRFVAAHPSLGQFHE